MKHIYLKVTESKTEMSAMEMVRNHYRESLKNNFEAWGIVMNPKTKYRLEEKRQQYYSAFTLDAGGMDKIFGMVIIPDWTVAENSAYIVDEFLGRQILKGK